jgi:hypothetical protein
MTTIYVADVVVIAGPTGRRPKKKTAQPEDRLKRRRPKQKTAKKKTA